MMYHSVVFGDKNTWDDWHIVPSSRPTFSMPEVKENFVDIPGADGIIDLTDSLIKRPTYKNREGDFEFIVVNDYGEWSERYSEIANFLHGRAMKCYLEDDPGYYYQGRFSVNNWKSDRNWSLITISYNVEPYKYDKFSDDSDWQYRPLIISRGPLNNYRVFEVNSSASQIVTVRERWIRPIITVTSNITLLHTFDGTSTTYSLTPGVNEPNGLVLKSGVNTLAFSGEGSITLDCRGGCL